MDYDLTPLHEGCKQFGLTLTAQQEQQFVQYYELLIEWNKVMNLTGITEFEDVLLKHFLDSLAVAKALDMKKIHAIIDIGTGAGFPGIPLKIMYPHLKVTLLDSLKKRINFLEEVINQLGLEKIQAFHGRAEELAKNKDHREKYDLCVSRAVANLATLSEYCLPYVRLGGNFVSYKSGKIEEELNNSKKAITILGGSLRDTVKFNLPDSDIERSLVVIHKKKSTSMKYPRKAGMPSKEPL